MIVVYFYSSLSYTISNGSTKESEMTVAELIAILQTMPQDLEVEVNNNGREIFAIEQVDYFSEEELDGEFEPSVMIQINYERTKW